MRNRQYIFPSLNFSCSGVITGWTLKGTHTANTMNAPSYVFEASPVMAVAVGDVFGVYVPASIGLRVAGILDALHTVQGRRKHFKIGQAINFSARSAREF